MPDAGAPAAVTDGPPDVSAASASAGTVPRHRVSPRLPVLIGLITFAVSLVLLSAVAAIGLTVGDRLVRDVEMRVLVSRIEASEKQMGEVQAQEARAVESYRSGALTEEQLDDQLVEIARRGAENVAAAGRQVAAADWLRWHTDVQAAQLAYLAHNRAWVAHLDRAAQDPTEFAQPQDAINDTFEQARQPLLDAVPSWDPLEVRPRVEKIFADGTADPSGSGGPQA